MCGIVGYVGQGRAVDFLISGLEKLEYRGYDSAGVSILNDGKISTYKKVGRIEALKEFLSSKEIQGNVGIGHTRWATHGVPSDVNSHPHLSQNGDFAVVHNGIIENYLEIRKSLQAENVDFISDTDTEVVAQLLEFIHRKNNNGQNVLKAIRETLQKLQGSYALAIIYRGNSNEIFAVRKDNPLIVGCGENENYVASDIPALLDKTKKIYNLPENRIAVVGSKEVKLYNENLDICSEDFEFIDWDVEPVNKGGYDCFMMKEIMEQPKVFANTVAPFLKNGKIEFKNLNFDKNFFENLEKIHIIACGSAHHVGVISKYIIEQLMRKPVEVDLASEFRYRSPIVSEKSLVIIISQSGETADSLAALREAKKSGAKILSIVNVVGSSVANESDYVIYTNAGAEVAVATTKAFTAQLAIMCLLGIYGAKILNKITENDYDAFIKNIANIPGQIQEILDERQKVEEVAKQFFSSKDAFFIGRTLDYGVCMEGSLKLKEISYVHSEAYAAGELKHGTIALIEQGTLVICVATQEKMFDKIMSNAVQVKARGARIVGLTTCEMCERFKGIAEFTFEIPKTNAILQPILSVIPLQLFSYYVAKFKGCDIDKPRNLAKSVTVE